MYQKHLRKLENSSIEIHRKEGHFKQSLNVCECVHNVQGILHKLNLCNWHPGKETKILPEPQKTRLVPLLVIILL